MIFNNKKNYASVFASNFLIFISLAIIAMVVITSILLPKYINSVAEEHSSKVIDYLEQDVQYPLLVGNDEALEEYAGSLGELPWISSVSIANTNFDKVYTIGETELANDQSLYGSDIKQWSGKKQLHSTKIIQIGEEDGPKTVGGYLHIGINKSHVNYAVIGMMAVVSVSILLSAVIMVPVYRRTSRKVAQPIVDLSESIKNTHKGQEGYQRITLTDVPQEISDAVSVVNKFVDSANQHNNRLEEEVERRTEELETAVDKLKVSENIRSSMMMNSSHDLRSPLTSLIGFIDLAREFTANKDEAKVMEALDIAHSASLEIEEQIETFLVYMGDEDSGTLRKDEINIDAVIHRVIHQLNATAIRSGNRTNYTHTGPYRIIVDKPKIERVIHGILSNAHNYCADGQVTIITSVDKELSIIIQDTGVGMDADRLESIFIKDYAGGESVHNGYRGVGIGLSMCKGWVNMMEGDISVESTKGKKTKFTIRIPVEVVETVV